MLKRMLVTYKMEYLLIFLVIFICFSILAWTNIKSGINENVYKYTKDTSEEVLATIYVVYALDTEAGYFPPSPELPVPYHATPLFGSMTEAFDLNWRENTSDSYGDMIKITWYVLSSERECQSTLDNCLSMHDYVMNYRSNIEEFGDEVAWHYHHTDWVEVENEIYDGIWSHIFTFDGTSYFGGTDVALAENILNHFLIDRGFFPENFRSGWTWENTDFSNWLEDIILYDYSNLSPDSGADYDWTRAPEWPVTQFYNPSLTDYQSVGEMNRFIIHCNISQFSANNDRMEEAIQKALLGEDVIYAFYSHAPSAVDRPALNVDSIIQQGIIDYAYLGIKFKYVTATEAMKLIRGFTDNSPPVIEFGRVWNSIYVHVSEDIFNFCPYMAVLFSDGVYSRVYGWPKYPNVFEFNLSQFNIEDIEKVGVAASDYAGNVSTKVEDFLNIAPNSFFLGCGTPVYNKKTKEWVVGACK